MTRARSLSRLANSNAFTVDTNLNVGIGSTTPDVKLEVGGNMEVSGILTATSFRADSLVVTGVCTLGITTGISALGVSGNVHATKFIGDGSGLTGLNVPVGFNELDAALFN